MIDPNTQDPLELAVLNDSGFKRYEQVVMQEILKRVSRAVAKEWELTATTPLVHFNERVRQLCPAYLVVPNLGKGHGRKPVSIRNLKSKNVEKTPLVRQVSDIVSEMGNVIRPVAVFMHAADIDEHIVAHNMSTYRSPHDSVTLSEYPRETFKVFNRYKKKYHHFMAERQSTFLDLLTDSGGWVRDMPGHKKPIMARVGYMDKKVRKEVFGWDRNMCYDPVINTVEFLNEFLTVIYGNAYQRLLVFKEYRIPGRRTIDLNDPKTQAFCTKLFDQWSRENSIKIEWRLEQFFGNNCVTCTGRQHPNK